MLRKYLKPAILILVILFGIAQCFSPKKNNENPESVTAFLTDTQASKEVKSILNTACFNCHSNHTQYPWYNAITPVNYWINSHIADGKKHFNASNWDGYSNKKKDHKLEELIEEVKEKEMPLPSYTWTYEHAKLSPPEIETLVQWAKHARLKYMFLKQPQ